MDGPPTDSDSEALLNSCLPTIEGMIDFVCRRNHLPRSDAEDFGSHVRLKLIDDDCGVLRRFHGRSSLKTYLSVVIQRLYIDYRRQAWGKWRPSSEAKRLGPSAVLLDQMIGRDGLTVDEAFEALTTNHRIATTRSDVEHLAARLPKRQRRRFETDDKLAEMAGNTRPLDLVVLDHEAGERLPELLEGIRRAMRSLAVEDRLVLTLRFEDGRSVADIASTLHLDQKGLYRRIGRLIKGLRDRLEAEGVNKDMVQQILDSESSTVELDRGGSGIAAPGPSISERKRQWW
jgi:RNA polymerase sigma factor for flagellar operon FliA